MEPYGAGRHTAFERYLLEQECAFIIRWLQDAPRRQRVVDVCCGNGSIGRGLTGAHLPSIGLDLDRSVLSVSRASRHDIPAVQADVLVLPFASESVDVITAIHCFDQLDRQRFLQSCRRVLRDEGLLIFDGVNRDSYKLQLKQVHRRVQVIPRRRPSDKWIDVLNWQGLSEALSGNGFGVKAVAGYSWLPFHKDSDSRFVRWLSPLEAVLPLGRFYTISPRILIAASKEK